MRNWLALAAVIIIGSLAGLNYINNTASDDDAYHIKEFWQSLFDADNQIEDNSKNQEDDPD